MTNVYTYGIIALGGEIMKTPKAYRFGPSTIKALDWLKSLPKHELFTETDLVEQAIMALYAEELAIEKSRKR